MAMLARQAAVSERQLITHTSLSSFCLSFTHRPPRWTLYKSELTTLNDSQQRCGRAYRSRPERPLMFTDKDLPLLAPAIKHAGITRVANVTGLDDIGIPVVVVARPDSRSLSVSQGKGATLPAAKLSGIMESLEQFHAEHVTLPLTLTTWRALKGRTRVVDVGRLPRVGRPFHPDARILWATGKDLASGQEVAVPFEMVHLDMATPIPEGSGYFPLGSNGLASGQTLDEAIAHGLWELIERDALALFYRRTPMDQALRRIRVDSVDDPVCRALLQRFAAANVGAVLWDMTSDVGIAAFVCSISERQLQPFRPVGTARGFGCHPNPAIALRRAITEAAQSRLTRITGSRDDVLPGALEAVRADDVVERQHAHLAQEGSVRRRFADVEGWVPRDMRAALEWTRERLAAVDLCEVVYVDLSQREMPFAVARSVVPGLEGFPDAPSYRPGERVRALAARHTP